MSLAAFLVIVAAIALETLGQLCFKRGISFVALAGQSILAYWGAILGNAWILIGLGAYAVEIVVGLAALSLAPLSVGSHLFLGEKLRAQSAVAILLITLGAVLVSWPKI